MSPSPFYRNALTAISARTAPLVGIFYAAKSLHVGERVVNQFTGDAGQPTGWVTDQFSKWVVEGEEWAHRVGHRYGMFGFEKGTSVDHTDRRHLSGQLAGDIANVILAYAATKALLPVRIGLSLYLSPAFSRGIVEPIRYRIIQPLTRRK